jgi:hypothetical protein
VRLMGKAALIGGTALLATLAVMASGVAGQPSPGVHDRGQLSGSERWCPRGDETGLRARVLRDKRLPFARRIARRHDCSVRVVRRNGEWLAITADFSWSRVNVAVRDRKVTGINGVF